jgi:methylene-tetrahydromethanopterin dehydrogenase
MRTSEVHSVRGSMGTAHIEASRSAEHADPRSTLKAPIVPARKKAKSAARAPRRAKEAKPGSLPILYMLSPQKFMSPFDCNMAIDSGYSIVLPYDNVVVGDVNGLVQDAMFSRPPKSATGVFIGGKDISLALAMMKAARAAMVPPFNVSVFADPGGSFTTAGAMVATVERVLARSFSRTWEGINVSVFGAMGVVGFASAVLAANAGARVRVVAHEAIEPLADMARAAKEIFGATLEPVAGQTDALKSKILATSDVAFTAGPAGVNILTRRQIARAPGLLIAADVNAVKPFGVEGMDLHMDGAPLPGSTTLGVGALVIGDVKYKTQVGLFQRMLKSEEALDLDFRDAFALAREIVSEGREPAKRRGKKAA